MAAAVAFVLLGDTLAAVGSLAPGALLLTALLVIINGLGYVELALSVVRPGSAYTLVRKGGRNGALPFFTGWALALASLGLTALLARGAGHTLSVLLADLLDWTVSAEPLAMAFVLAVVLISGLGVWGKRRLPFALPLIALLALLAGLGLSRRPTISYVPPHAQPGPAITLLMSAFIALEIITGHQAEIRQRAVNLPRVLLGAPGLVALLGAVLALVTVRLVPPQTLVEVALGQLGQVVLGRWGRVVVLAIGTLVLALSTGRSLNTLVRHLYIMSRDGFWPMWLRTTFLRRGMPLGLLLIVGSLILPAVWIPLQLLSRVSGLLYLFVLIAVNLTLAQRPREGPEPSFALPFHPWVPALTLAVDLLVIPLWGLEVATICAGLLAVGGLIYLAYGRERYIEAQEGVTVFRPPAIERTPTSYRVLVPVANPHTAGTLLQLAGRLAHLKGGDVLALQVVVVEEPVPLEAGRRRAREGQALLEKMLALANEEGIPIQTMTRVARSVAEGIVDAAAEEGADLILLGWQEPPRARDTSPGPIVAGVLRDAPCDTLVVRGELELPLERILVPTAGGTHARMAAELALAMGQSFEARVTLLCIQTAPGSARETEALRCRMEETLRDLTITPDHPPEQKIVVSPDVVEGIVGEAREHDLVLLGVSEESLFDRLVFGSVPLRVAGRVPGTALVQSYRGITGVWTRRFLHVLRHTVPALSEEEQLEVREELSRGSQPGINFFILIVLSSIIAALGLLLDSPAVVIGAMLVAPLMSPLLAFSLGLVVADLRMIRFSAESVLKGVALAMLLAAFMGLLSPLKTITLEMQARAQPTLLDMAVALASGMAGAYAMARKDVGAALPGVAIAAALMPPLATVGLGVSLGDLRVAGGAFLLFVTNIAAISLAGGLIFLALGMRPRTWGPESRQRFRRGLAAAVLLLLVIAVPLGVIMGGVVRRVGQEQLVREVLNEQLSADAGRLVSLELEERGGQLLVIATIRSTRAFDQERVRSLAEEISRRLDRSVHLEAVVLPVIYVEGEAP